jgi:phosphoglycolate phosphatase-like HAD superfamily hydrolase
MIADKGGNIFEGVYESISSLHKNGFKLAIASNGRHPYLSQILKSFELEDFFVPLIAINDEEISVKSDILKAYMKKYNVSKDELLMVGDRSSDLEAAEEVCCAFIGCDYGFAANEIKNAEIVVSSFAQILNYL